MVDNLDNLKETSLIIFFVILPQFIICLSKESVLIWEQLIL